jgi:hypothetical protein
MQIGKFIEEITVVPQPIFQPERADPGPSRPEPAPSTPNSEPEPAGAPS